MRSPVSFLLGHPKGRVLGTGLQRMSLQTPGWSRLPGPTAPSDAWKPERPRQASPAGLLPSVTLGRSLHLPAVFFSSETSIWQEGGQSEPWPCAPMMESMSGELAELVQTPALRGLGDLQLASL